MPQKDTIAVCAIIAMLEEALLAAVAVDAVLEVRLAEALSQAQIVADRVAVQSSAAVSRCLISEWI